MVLTSQPTANVVIDLSSSDTTEGTVSPVSLTFTSANWNTPQTVTVTGVNDVVDDGDIAYTIVTAPATSGDPTYSGMNASDVSVTNIDNDTAGFIVTPISGLTTTEAGGRAHFTVVLNTQPSADVTIALSSSNPSEGTVSPASLTFTSDNWNMPQTVDVTGVDDALDDGDIAYTIVTAAAVSADPGYNGLEPARCDGDQHRQRHRRHHRQPDLRPDDDGKRRHRDVYDRAELAADGGRDDRAELERHDGGHRQSGERDVHDRELEHAADGHGHRRQ